MFLRTGIVEQLKSVFWKSDWIKNISKYAAEEKSQSVAIFRSGFMRRFVVYNG